MTGFGGKGVTFALAAATTGLVSRTGVSLTTTGAGASFVLFFFPNQLTGFSFFNKVFFSGFASAVCSVTERCVVTGGNAGSGIAVAEVWTSCATRGVAVSAT